MEILLGAAVVEAGVDLVAAAVEVLRVQGLVDVADEMHHELQGIGAVSGVRGGVEDDARLGAVNEYVVMRGSSI